MEQIITGIWLGDDDDVTEAEKRGYSILACCKEGPNGHRAMLDYHTLGAPKDKDYLFAERSHWMALNIIDMDDPDMIPDTAIDAGLNFLKRERDSGKKVFVHCNAGRSRGPTLVLMFLRTIGEMPQSFPRAERIFRTLYDKYDPGVGMRTHARDRWATLPTFYGA